MSLGSRSPNSNAATKDRDYIERFKTYSYTYQTDREDLVEESLFDEDEYPNSRYMEKERALKKINEELEKKTNEIFKKIDRYRSNRESSSANMMDEAGQGDARSSYDSGTDPQFLSGNSIDMHKSSFHQSNPPSPLCFNGSYFNLSRASSSDAEVGNNGSSSRTSSSGGNRRPATAGAMTFPSYSVTQTEASIRRAETAKPIEGIEEKHQARLQKATESVLKCVQSKLVNYEHRLTDMHLQFRQKIQENTMLEAKVKALDEDRKRLLKSVQSLQSTTDKFSKSAENSKINLNLKAQAFASLKKEMDSLKRDLKQKNGMIQSLQTRLDRCTEENRRLKSQHQSTQLNMKQQQNEDRSAMEELKQRLAQMEQQKVSLQTTVEKQAQLIKNLRNQKVSLTNIVQKNKIKVENWSEFDDDVDENESISTMQPTSHSITIPLL